MIVICPTPNCGRKVGTVERVEGGYQVTTTSRHGPPSYETKTATGIVTPSSPGLALQVGFCTKCRKRWAVTRDVMESDRRRVMAEPMPPAWEK